MFYTEANVTTATPHSVYGNQHSVSNPEWVTNRRTLVFGGFGRQVAIDDRSGAILEAWTGYKVAWTMARGYDGAFGRKVNAPYVWIPLSVLFFAALVDWRRPWRIVHLDLLVLLADDDRPHWWDHETSEVRPVTADWA
mgnify:CR=1 FL=1